MDRPTELTAWVERRRKEGRVRAMRTAANGAAVEVGSDNEVAFFMRVVCDGGLEIEYFSNSIEIRKAKQRGELPEDFDDAIWRDALLAGAGMDPLAKWSLTAAAPATKPAKQVAKTLAKKPAKKTKK
jgi:hypothetical protein